ncbi:MAG: non-hydrolyzing UDP-N-acetylglucosamine 2-epimerase [Bacillota bacterium]
MPDKPGAPIKILSCFGTRPEATKMAPVVRGLAADPAFKSVLAVTGQHREMLDQVLDHFGLKPDHDLNIMVPRQTLGHIVTAALRGLEDIISEERPDLVLVHGDAHTSFVGALAAFYHKVPVGHVEAGLRTHDKWRPYPEEMNRVLADDLSDSLYAPTATSKANLLAEGKRAEDIYVTGNTAIDALSWTVRAGYRFERAGLEVLTKRPERLIVVECHRRENLGQPLEQIALALRDLARARHDIIFFFSVHKNPDVQEPVRRILGGEERVILDDPVDYADWANLLDAAHLIVTDSGGLQEEAPFLGTPVLLCRDQTERPEAVEAGTVRIVGTDRRRIAESVDELLDDAAAYAAMSEAPNPYGDGRASERILAAIKHRFGLGPRPADFVPRG